MENPSWLSILPPLVAIVTALVTKQVFLSLFAGLWLGWILLNGGSPVAGLRDSIQALVDVFKDEGQTQTIAFSAIVGSLLALTQRSGGVHGFIRWVTCHGYVRSPRGAQILASILGLGIFVESNITCLISGSVSRPLFDKYSLSREKLAYICDATSAPVCILIPMNGWGAFILSVLGNYPSVAPLPTLLRSIPFNFYALLTVACVLFIVWTGHDWGPMARAEARARKTGKVLRDGAEPLVSIEVLGLQPKEGVEPRARNMLVPMGVLLVMMPLGLYVTGDSNLLAGNGSTSVLWAVTLATVVAGGMYILQGIFRLQEVIDLAMKGIGGLIPLAILMILAFAIGDLSDRLSTGPYLAGTVGGLLNTALVPAIMFVASGFIAFSTGTSWGTYAIMLPIGISMAQELGANLYLVVGAVLGGGVFGDHCSPISDTTIISSMAAGSDHIDHVNTQLPYALLTGLLATTFYLLVGLALH